MENIGKRIKYVIKESGIKQKEMAESLCISDSALSQMINGKIGLGNQTISSICRMYNVNEEWLRTGAGEPFRSTDVLDELMGYFQELRHRDPDDIEVRFIRMLAKLPREYWHTIDDIMVDMINNKKTASSDAAAD